MKRILLIPIKLEGVVDVRSIKDKDYIILDNVQYLEQIQSTLISKKKSTNDYKYCQFEEKSLIPFFIKIKNKLGNGIQEFEIESLTFSEIIGEDDYKKTLIEERYILPIKEKLQSVIYDANFLMISEKLGEKVDEEKYFDLGIEKEKLEKEIKEFDYKKYLDEIV